MMETPKINRKILTRGLPKTGQTSIYVAGDDGTYQAGWWQKRLNANNRSRFIMKTVAGDDIIIDRATGLWWALDEACSINNNRNVLTWSAAVQYPTGRSYAGKSDWRLPNVQEIVSIINFDVYNPAIYGSTFFLSNLSFWTSTTSAINSLNAWFCDIASGDISFATKLWEFPIYCCRGGI